MHISSCKRPVRAWSLFGLAAFLTVAAVGCGESNPPVFDQNGGEVTPVLLRGEVFSSSSALGRPAQLRLSGRWLWVSDTAGEPDVHLFEVHSGEHVRSVGRRGEGPGDFLTPRDLMVPPGDTSGTVWIWDPRLRRVTGLEPVADAGPSIVTFPPDASTTRRMAWVASDRLIGVNALEEERFTIFSSSGERLEGVPGNLLGPPEVPIRQRATVSVDGFLACSWPNRGFAIIYFDVGRIEFYDMNAQLLRLADVPYPSEAFVDDGSGNLVRNRSRSYYRSCTTVGDLLLVAFSGRLAAEFEGAEAYSGRFIHVFDWSGSLNNVVELDRDIYGIAASASGRTLFATSLTSANIYRFNLPEDFAW